MVLLDEASRLGMEERVGGRRAQWPAGSCKTTDVVVGREAISSRRGRLLGRVPVDWRCGGHRGQMCVEGRAGASGKEKGVCVGRAVSHGQQDAECGAGLGQLAVVDVTADGRASEKS